MLVVALARALVETRREGRRPRARAQRPAACRALACRPLRAGRDARPPAHRGAGRGAGRRRRPRRPRHRRPGRAGDRVLVDSGVERIWTVGGGARRQRQAFERTGRWPASWPTWSRVRRRRRGRMRVLVAPDKFAGTLTAVEAAEAIAGRLGRHAPADVLDHAPMADGGPASSTSCTPPSGASSSRSRCGARSVTRCPAGVLLVGGRAYVESAQGCGLHLTGAGGARRAGDVVRRRRAGRRGGRRPGRPRSSSVSAAAARTTQGRRAGGAGGDRGPAPGRRGRRARGGRPRSTWATLAAARGGPDGRRERRGQPTDRAVRGDEDVRPAEGHRRGAPARRRRRCSRRSRRPRPAYVAGAGRRRRGRRWATRSWCWAGSVSPGSTSSWRPWASRTGPAPRIW